MLVRARSFPTGVELLVGSEGVILAHGSNRVIGEFTLDDISTTDLMKFTPLKVYSCLYFKGSDTVSCGVYNESDGFKQARPLSYGAFRAAKGSWLRSKYLVGHAFLETKTSDGIIVQELFLSKV